MIRIDRLKSRRQKRLFAFRANEKSIMVHVKAREESLRCRGRIYLQTTGRVRITGHTPLFFRPTHHRRGPGWPAFALGAVRPRVSLVLEIEQTNMPERLRTKTADFEVIFHQVQWLAQWMNRRRKKLTLI